jgi:Glycerophosphoryl diester phosphodiesterase family/HEAT repeats
MKRNTVLVSALFLLIVTSAHAGILERGKVQLVCHRTANRDFPENTLESLALAARMGCNIVEIDVRRTLDGQLVLNHDDMLERLTSGMGNVELTSYDELSLLETGTWMGDRFPPLRIPRFTEALRVAREQGIGLVLDIKTKGIAPQLIAELESEGMLQRVIFGGEWSDVRALYPAANSDRLQYVQPHCTPEQVAALHNEGKLVIGNFAETPQEIDVEAMRAAVSAGVDALNVDYPRVGADAVGRPVEAKLSALANAATTGPTPARTAAIRELSYYYGFSTQQLFVRLLHDADDQVSRAAAVALVRSVPVVQPQILVAELSAKEKTARKNAAWALGILGAPATEALIALLRETDPEVLKETLLSLSRCPGEVPANVLLPFLTNDTPTVRGAAALALARHQPDIAAHAVPELLQKEEREAVEEYAAYVRRGKPQLTQQEIDPIIETYREQMKFIQALEHLDPPSAFQQLAAQAFRPAEDFTRVTGLVAGYRMWDRIGTDPVLAIQQLGSSDATVADRAEWMLIQAGPAVLSAVRSAMPSSDAAVRPKLIRILAWQGDAAAVALLKKMRESDTDNQQLIDWAVHKIETLNFNAPKETEARR